jgi:hypothetical protein
MNPNTVSYKGSVIATRLEYPELEPQPSHFSFLGFGLESQLDLDWRFSVVAGTGNIGPEEFAADVLEAKVLWVTLDLLDPDSSRGTISYTRKTGESCTAGIEGRANQPKRGRKLSEPRKKPEPKLQFEDKHWKTF